MSDKSLFAYLMRSPAWISFAIALALVLFARLILPEAYSFYALSIAIPFVVIGVMAGWKEMKVPGRARVEATVEAVTAMSWRDFSALMEQAFQRDGFTVTRINGAADFRIVKERRVSLVCCKRWKAATHGLEPLRELYTLRRAEEAHEAIYVALGDLSDNAQRFATERKIVLMQGLGLAALLKLPKKPAKKTS
jgi:restriction system protein